MAGPSVSAARGSSTFAFLFSDSLVSVAGAVVSSTSSFSASCGPPAATLARLALAVCFRSLRCAAAFSLAFGFSCTTSALGFSISSFRFMAGPSVSAARGSSTFAFLFSDSLVSVAGAVVSSTSSFSASCGPPAATLARLALAACFRSLRCAAAFSLASFSFASFSSMASIHDSSTSTSVTLAACAVAFSAAACALASLRCRSLCTALLGGGGSFRAYRACR